MNSIVDLVPILKETLENNKNFIMPVRGTSMLPFIYETNHVILANPTNLKKNDIIFYQRNDGNYVLHRIYQIKKEHYVLLGDNQINKEEPIYYKQIIGKVIAIKRKNKTDYLNSFSYKLYLFFWHSLLIRKIFFPLTRRIKNV